MGKTIVVTSGKGGVGKTMFATNIAATYALHGASVVVLDTCTGYRNVDLYFGHENDVVYDSSDVTNGICDIDRALIRDERFEDLSILCAAQVQGTSDIPTSEQAAQELVRALVDRFDYVVIDTPSGESDVLTALTDVADLIAIVTTPEYASVRNADSIDRNLTAAGHTDQIVIVNKAVPELMNEGVVPKLREVARILRPEIAGVIQQDKVINVSTNLGVPVVLKTGTYISRNFESIANRIIAVTENPQQLREHD